MAEQEVIKHTKEIFSHLRSKDHSARHKMIELAIEVSIIVFAVSISIWLHGIGEHRHEQEQVKTFLLGLKKDLQVDVGVLKKDIQEFQEINESFRYLATLDPRGSPDNNKFDAAFDPIVDPIFVKFISRRGRYDGFKFSGQLTHIENEALLEDIVELYEHKLIGVYESEGFWNNDLNNLKAYLARASFDGNRATRYSLVTSPMGKHLCESMSFGPLNSYQATLASYTLIIKEIERLYPKETRG